MHAVGDVGEVSHLGADFGGGLDRFRDGEMSGMGVELEAVEDEDVEIFQEVEGFVGDSADVGAVGEWADAEAEDGHFAVEEGDGDPFGAADLEWAGDEMVKQVRAEDFGGGIGLAESVA